MSQSRHLAAIMFTDIVGYTALMGDDEDKAFELLNKNRELQKPLIEKHGGKWIKELGDGVIATFATATEAVQCAISIQQACHNIPGLKLRIGIHLGDIVFENDDVFGDGVNIASRLQAIASPESIYISEAVHNNITNKKEINTKFVRAETLKNVKEPVRVYLVKTEEYHQTDTNATSKLRKVQRKGKLFIEKKPVLLLLAGIIIIVVGLFFYFKNGNKNNSQETVETKKAVEKSIAVLPFINMSNDPEQDYFADGMMDEILNHLFKIGDLRIISRTSAMSYKGSKKPIKIIAKELGVAHLLEGSVQKEGQKIRIRIQLIDGETDEHLWAENYDREFKDVFAIQSHIAQKVAAELKVKINPDVKRRIESKPTENTEVYNLYLQATDASFPIEKTKTILEQIIKLDSNFAEAYSRLSFWWLNTGGFGGKLKAKEVLKKAIPLLQKALELNPDLASAHRNKAMLSLWYEWDFNTVQNEYQKVIQLNPSNTEIFAGFTDYLLAVGKFEEALKMTTEALINNRNSYLLWTDLAWAYYFNDNVQKSLETIETALSLFPQNDYITINLIRIKTLSNKHKEAIQDYENYYSNVKERPSPLVLSYTAIAYYKAGKKDKAEFLLNELKVLSMKSSVGSPSFFISGVYATIGESDLAIQWLKKAYQDHEVEMYWLKVEPLFQPLRNDKRFQDIINRIGYPK